MSKIPKQQGFWMFFAPKIINEKPFVINRSTISVGVTFAVVAVRPTIHIASQECEYMDNRFFFIIFAVVTTAILHQCPATPIASSDVSSILFCIFAARNITT